MDNLTLDGREGAHASERRFAKGSRLESSEDRLNLVREGLLTKQGYWLTCLLSRLSIPLGTRLLESVNRGILGDVIEGCDWKI
jgi:hypothetical protein